MSAETGVGPSIASGSHVCSGSCADFAAAPINRNTHVQNSHGSRACGLAKTSPNETEFTRENIMKIANMMPTSPTTLITKALRAAATADGLKNQKPMRKYEARPTSPQPTSNPTKLSERTSVSIANTKKFMYAKNRATALSDHMYPMEYRWIKNPTPVIISDQMSDSGSSSKPKLNPGSHENSC